jgi:hypothetical protein
MLRHAELSFGHGGVVALVDGWQIFIRLARKGRHASPLPLPGGSPISRL